MGSSIDATLRAHPLGKTVEIKRAHGCECSWVPESGVFLETLKLHITEIIEHCCDVKTFRFGLEKEVPFKPGQYLVLTLDINGRDASKAFSISNSPTEKGYVQFTKKLTGSDFSNALNRLSGGDEVSVRFPMGHFIFEGQYSKAAFLSGGIGITPVRSIFKYAADRRLSSDIRLFYSSRTEEYLIFKNDFDAMAEVNKNIRIVYTLTHCDEKIRGCRLGMIDASMVKEEIPDIHDWVFFVCGPPGMVSSIQAMLKDELAVAPEKIIVEHFMGYD